MITKHIRESEESKSYGIHDILDKLNERDRLGQWHPIYGINFCAVWESNDGKVRVVVKKPNYTKSKWEFIVEINGKIVSQDNINVSGETREEQMMDIAELVEEMYKNPPSKKESKRISRNHNLFEDDKRELRKIKNAIYKNPEVKRLTSKILKDDGAWKPFKDLINAIRESHPAITGVYYGDDPHFLGGYRWENGKMTGKYRVIEIETEFGTMNGHIICFGAGTIEDPLDAYDMVLEIY